MPCAQRQRGTGKFTQGVVNKIAFIKSVEDGYFDGMAIVERGQGKAFPTIDDMRGRVNTITQRHNDGIRSVITSYNRLHAGFWDYQLAEMENYLVMVDPPWIMSWFPKK